MTREADWFESGGVSAPPFLLPPALTILAQFDDEEVLLDREDIARLTGCSRSISKRCLVTLSDLGYLVETDEGVYRLAGVESNAMGAGRDGDGTPDTAV